MASLDRSQRNPAYRNDIDGMRAIAVLAVIVNHFFHSALPGGYLGVDVFFVISGFVITTSLQKTVRPSLADHLLSFYSRRIKRLMPALLTVVFISSALIRLFDPDAQISTLTGLFSIFGASNIFLFLQATNYFGHAVERNIFSHTWSLGVEEQFYVLYPFLIRWHMPHGLRTLRDDRYRLTALAVLSAVSLAFFIAFYPAHQPAAYFLMPFRFFELGLGCLLAMMSIDLRVWTVLPRLIPPSLALALFIPPFLFADRFPVAATITIVFAATLLIGSSRHGTATYRALSSPVPAYLGRISYSLYLWHWPVLCLSRWTIGVHAWTLPIQAALILALSAGSYHLIEHPLRSATWIGGRRGPLIVGLPVMVCVAALVYLGQSHALPRFTGNRSAEATLDAPEPGYVAPFSHRRIDDCYARNVLDTTRSSLAANLARCTAGNNPNLKLIFIGDSHAMDLFPMADRLAASGVATVLNVFQPGCRVPPLPNNEPVCGFAPTLLQHAVAPTGRTVLVLRLNFAPRRIDGDLSQYTSRLEQLVNQASAANVSFIYIAPAPKYYSVGPGNFCAPQWFRPVWAMDEHCRTGFREDRTEQLARRSDFFNYLTALSRSRPNFFVYDPFDLLCGSSTGDCTPMRDGRLIYRDENHLTAQGSQLLAEPFAGFLTAHNLLPVPTPAQTAILHL